MTDQYFQGVGGEGLARGFMLDTVCRTHGLVASVPFPNTDFDTLESLKHCALRVDSILYDCPEEDLTVTVRFARTPEVTMPNYGAWSRIRR